MLTPRYFSRTIGAGLIDAPITAYGRHILIASISASTIQMSIDDGPPQQIIGGEHVDVGDNRYNRIVLRNTGAAGSTVVLFLSDVWVGLEAMGGILAGIAASLVSIDQEISGAAAAAVAGQLADTVCPITPGPAQLLFAANAARTSIQIHAPRTNGAGLIYLGITAARATAIDKFEVLSAGESWEDLREKGGIFACSSTGAEIVNGKEC